MADATQEPIAWAIRSDDSETHLYLKGEKFFADGLALGFCDIEVEDFDAAVALARELNARKTEARAIEERLRWLRSEPLGVMADA